MLHSMARTMVIVGAVIALVATASTSHATPNPPTTAPGAVVWYDLLTEDAEAVLDFYRGIFGWDIQPWEPGAWVVLHQGVGVVLRHPPSSFCAFKFGR